MYENITLLSEVFAPRPPPPRRPPRRAPAPPAAASQRGRRTRAGARTGAWRRPAIGGRDFFLRRPSPPPLRVPVHPHSADPLGVRARLRRCTAPPRFAARACKYMQICVFARSTGSRSGEAGRAACDGPKIDAPNSPATLLLSQGQPELILSFTSGSQQAFELTQLVTKARDAGGAKSLQNLCRVVCLDARSIG